MQSMVLSRESISSVYALVIPVSPLFATSSFTQRTGIHPDPVIGTALRRACGASCIRLLYRKKGGQTKSFSWRGELVTWSRHDTCPKHLILILPLLPSLFQMSLLKSPIEFDGLHQLLRTGCSPSTVVCFSAWPW